jgi:RNA polymerase sigma factor (sigma-70 family)
MDDRSRPDPPLWINPRDKRGREIDRELILSAQRNWRRALHYAQRESQDETIAAEVLERVVHSVWNAIRRNQPTNSIQNLDSYVFWAFIRRLNKIVALERRIRYVASLEVLDTLKAAQDTSWVSGLETEFLIKELMSYMDRRTRHIFSLRMAGISWKEIARELGTSANSAQVLFNYGLERVRERIFRRSRSGSP